MPRGGARVGAGRKPKTRRSHWLTGDAGKRGLALVPPVSPGEVSQVRPDSSELEAVIAPLGPPAMLTEDERPYWALWEPLARRTGQLTAATQPGFVLLCQVASRAAELWGQVRAVGFTYEKVTIDGAGQEHRELKSHPLLAHYRGLMARQEQLFARYGLASMGKVQREKPKQDSETEELGRLMAIR